MRDSVCIVDVGSSSVGVCIVTEDKTKPLISKTVRVPISGGTEEAKTALPTLAVQAVGKAFEALKDAPPPKQVIIVLASPWYNAYITTITTKSEKPVKVTQGTVDRAIKEYFARKGGNAHQGTLIESSISQAFVNGYPTSLKNPVIGNILKINHYESEADASFLKSLTDAALKAFPHAKVQFHSFAFAAFVALRSVRDENNFIILDVGGEITDVAVAHHDGLRFTGTYPAGTLSIVRALAEKDGSLADTRSRLALFAKGELSAEESVAMETKFATANAEWNKQYADILSKAVTEVAIPQTTLLFADPDELKWIEKMISNLHGAFSTRTTLITPDFFHAQISLTEDAVYDAFLSVEALFFHITAKGK